VFEHPEIAKFDLDPRPMTEEMSVQQFSINITEQISGKAEKFIRLVILVLVRQARPRPIGLVQVQ